jgi:hypothetical protein
MNNHLFHFIDTARLPWIIETGELQLAVIALAVFQPTFFGPRRITKAI